MDNVSSGCCKNPAHGTRNNWVTMEFNTKCRYNCFGKQSHIDICIEGFRELETFRFEFGEFGFSGVHVHFQVNVPKCYSLEEAEIMLKSQSAKKIFEQHPGFRKRYPNGGFWSGYEHHESTGIIDLEKSIIYCRSQQQRHGVHVTRVRRRVRYGKTYGLAEERRRNGIIGAQPLFHCYSSWQCYIFYWRNRFYRNFNNEH
jgi:hypothetical protein